MVELISVNGNISTILPLEGHEKVTFDQIKQAIGGGYVEHVYLPNGKEIWVDEDGRAKGFKYNVNASNLTKNLVLGDIVGDMVINNVGDIED